MKYIISLKYIPYLGHFCKREDMENAGMSEELA